MKLVIWGCNGFIASLICRGRYTWRFDEIVGIDVDQESRNAGISRYLSFSTTSASDLSKLIKEGDEVINCAAVSNPRECAVQPDVCRSVNELLAKRILQDSLLGSASRIVHFSSFHALVSSGHLYGKTKLKVEQFIETNPWYKSKVVCLRLGSVVTEKKPAHNRIRKVVLDALSRNLFNLEAPYRVRSYLGGDCFAEVYWAIHNSSRTGLINCWGSEWVSDLAVANYVSQKLGVTLPPEKLSMLGSVNLISQEPYHKHITGVKIQSTRKIIDSIINANKD